MPSAPATSPKRKCREEKVAGSCGQVSCFKVVWDRVLGKGSREVGVKPWDLQGRGWG